MLNTRLKLLRKKLNLTQKQIAEAMNVATQAYQRYEKGSQIPGSDKIAKMANNLKVVNLNWLLTGKGSMLKTEVSIKKNMSSPDPKTEKMLIMLENMSEEDRQAVFQYIQEKKRIQDMNKEIEKLKKNIKKMA